MPKFIAMKKKLVDSFVILEDTQSQDKAVFIFFNTYKIYFV